jgi:hypothetical protein
MRRQSQSKALRGRKPDNFVLCNKTTRLPSRFTSMSRASGLQCFASQNKSKAQNILGIAIALLYTAKQPSSIWEGT